MEPGTPIDAPSREPNNMPAMIRYEHKNISGGIGSDYAQDQRGTARGERIKEADAPKGQPYDWQIKYKGD